jgi:spore coat polysaccharide biosynthesis protein SpsF
MTYVTEQEVFWAGDFGDDYINRNSHDGDYDPTNLALFSKILSHTSNIDSILELGANVGLNLKALNKLLPKAKLTGVEINKSAVEQLKNIPNTHAINESLLSFTSKKKYSMSLIKGVLIHINPEELSTAYETLYNSSSDYICVIEYYNPSPIEIGYRGHQGKLFKRDFAGEIMDKYPDLSLVDYGFLYNKDNNFKFDDSTWFLLKKQN